MQRLSLSLILLASWSPLDSSHQLLSRRARGTEKGVEEDWGPGKRFHTKLQSQMEKSDCHSSEG